MFSFFRKKPAVAADTPPAAPVSAPAAAVAAAPVDETPQRRTWLDKLRTGLRRTGSGIAQVFTGTQIDDALYEELEAALLMADAGVKATEFLLVDLKRRVQGRRRRPTRRASRRCSRTRWPNCSRRSRSRCRSARTRRR